MGRDGPQHLLCQHHQSIHLKSRCDRIPDEMEIRMRKIRNRIRVSNIPIPSQRILDLYSPYLQAESVSNRYPQNLKKMNP